MTVGCPVVPFSSRYSGATCHRLVWLLPTKSSQATASLESHKRTNNAGDKFTFTIEEGANGTNNRISVNYDGFIDDVSVGDILLVDGGIQSLMITDKSGMDVHTEVVDGGTFKSRCGSALHEMIAWQVLPGKWSWLRLRAS